uniref:Uncharacterized protein n=1 Tax=Glossina palpalis gambiensis TaxID=67801 RepID=A0A1B0BWI8_9MUSC
MKKKWAGKCEWLMNVHSWLSRLKTERGKSEKRKKDREYMQPQGVCPARNCYTQQVLNNTAAFEIIKSNPNLKREEKVMLLKFKHPVELQTHNISSYNQNMASLSITCHYLTYLTVVYILLIVMLCCHNAVGVLGKSQMCEVETGQTNIILDIEESRGDLYGDLLETKAPQDILAFSNSSNSKIDR